MKHGKIRRVVRPWLCDTASSSCVQAAGPCPFHRPCSPPAESTKGGFTPVFLGLWSQKEEMLTLMAPESGRRRGWGVTWTETWSQAGTILYVLCVVVLKGRGWWQ